MRVGAIALACCVALGGLASAAEPTPVATIQKFMDSFNKGDSAAAAATHAANADLAIIDEVPPFLWRGPQAFSAWAAALDADSKKRAITDPSVTLGAPTRQEQAGDRAWLIVPAVYSFKDHGVAMSEKAQMTFVLTKGADGWLIQSWTWTGPKPEKVR